MPEDFSQVFTVEYFSIKEVWEVIHTCEGLNEAINYFRKALLEDSEAAMRITSPTEKSLYYK
jgi:hypothetical protein